MSHIYDRLGITLIAIIGIRQNPKGAVWEKEPRVLTTQG